MPFEDIIGADPEVALGAYDLFGTELDSLFSGYGPIVGADPGPAAAAKGAAVKKQFERMLAGRHAAMLAQRPITKAREYPLPFPTTTVNAGTTTTIQTQPQVPFRGRRLVIPSDIAGIFLVNDLKVGKNSMFAASGPVPARLFSEVAVGVDLNLDTGQISQIISVNVTNTSGANANFNAAMIGTSVE